MSKEVEFPSVEDRWMVIKSFFEEKGLVRQQLESFNKFVTETLQKLIDENGSAELAEGYKIKFGKVRFGRPLVKEPDGINDNITPTECRIRDLTYSAPIYVQAQLIGPRGDIIDSDEVEIGYMPIMLRSVLDPLSKMSPEELIEAGEDPRDPGGYFIIDGSERVVVTQEDLALNKVLVDKGGPQTTITHTAKVLSSTLGYRVQVIVERQKDGTLHAIFPPLPGKVPLVVLLRALGIESDKDITSLVSLDPEIQQELLSSIEQAAAMPTVEEALDFIGSRVAYGVPREKRIERAQQLLDNNLLPHLGTTPDARLKKAIFLAHMARKLLEVYLERREPDDKDHYANRRLKLTGDLMAALFRANLKSLIKDITYQLERSTSKGGERLKLRILIRPNYLGERVRQALATGNWVGGRTGVSQLLDRTNWLSTLSHLRRVVSPLSRTQPHYEARELHMTQWGRICPFETPEGPNIGLVKNLALSAYISVGVPEEEIEALLKDLGMIPIEDVVDAIRNDQPVPEEAVSGATVYLNGRPVGYYSDANELAQKLRKLRREGKLHYEVGIGVYENDDGTIKEVYVNADAGRVLRPVFVVENGELKLKPEHVEKLRRGEWTFRDLLLNGIVELLDVDEEENAYIALDPKDLTPEHTHMEIWVPAILGVAASTIPYLEHNQSPRNSYQSAMTKQALGLYAANFMLRTDTRGYLLHYPERPLAQTRHLDIIGYNDRPAGQNAIAAIMSYTGYNIEDAIIMNKSSVDRGFMRATFFRLYQTEEQKYPGGQEDRIEVPRAELRVRGFRGPEAYKKLDEDGIVQPETYVVGGEVIIGKTSPPRFTDEYKEMGPVAVRRRDTSISVRHGEEGVVDTVMVTQNIDGIKMVKIKVRDLRIPEIGDKFASRHGQKGVASILLPQYDMPYSEFGLVPDMILNPHAFPSRMTLGQLIESIAAKAASFRGKEVDATPFYKEPLDDLRKILVERGYPPDGTEVMFDGRTGEMVSRPVFIGVVFYQRLYHMVADKIHARARGPVQILTRQPTEGRTRKGGLRFGEMERDVLVAHGVAQLLIERLLKSSDATRVWVCAKCGHIGWWDAFKGKPVCPIHGEEGDMHQVEVSYAFKLLLQEIMSLVIMPRLRLGDRFSKI